MQVETATIRDDSLVIHTWTWAENPIQGRGNLIRGRGCRSYVRPRRGPGKDREKEENRIAATAEGDLERSGELGLSYVIG